MTYLLGLLTGAAFFACFLTAYLIGRKANTQPVTVKRQQETPDEEAKRKAKELQDHFQMLMNYDVSQALQRKKVT